MWFVEVPLARGRYYYQFLVDSEPVLDPDAMCAVSKARNSSNVLLIALG